MMVTLMDLEGRHNTHGDLCSPRGETLVGRSLGDNSCSRTYSLRVAFNKLARGNREGPPGKSNFEKLSNYDPPDISFLPACLSRTDCGQRGHKSNKVNDFYQEIPLVEESPSSSESSDIRRNTRLTMLINDSLYHPNRNLPYIKESQKSEEQTQESKAANHTNTALNQTIVGRRARAGGSTGAATAT
ncbi:hypothetical protein K0M31_013336 [Melipona bicolor]|uniref:Uncharacterized protein n=1 Tax=Melipona bicolor TaxID=60889 RepID=A0AA40KGH4_9HYME|nr:hypothetical protein K0M31_013336 [Melipona bicolor]